MLLFAFFMISDPKTTPDSRAGRVLFAGLVALGAALVQFGLFRPNALLWSLVAVAPLTPLINRMLPGTRYDWHRPVARASVTLLQKGLTAMTLFDPASARRAARVALLSIVAWMCAAQTALAFCGFYVTKADTTLFNRASKVVLVRDGDRTVVTMANDFQGDLTEFAVVIPVPTLLTRDQIHVGDQAVIDHLDAYTAPRLVEYFDHDPCRPIFLESAATPAVPRSMQRASASRDAALGVTIEATYTVGEYDIVILSAEQSGGLETWLRGNGYRMPAGAREVLGSYIKQGMRFFVAQVNLEERAALAYAYLRPLQIAYESPKFMLPIRLGTVNADGPQDLVRLHADPQGPGRNTELPDGEAADRDGAARLPEGPRRVRRLLPGDVHPTGRRGEPARGLPRVRLGHGLVRPLCRRPAQQHGAAGARGVLGDQSRRRARRLRHPPASAL